MRLAGTRYLALGGSAQTGRRASGICARKHRTHTGEHYHSAEDFFFVCATTAFPLGIPISRKTAPFYTHTPHSPLQLPSILQSLALNLPPHPRKEETLLVASRV